MPFESLLTERNILSDITSKEARFALRVIGSATSLVEETLRRTARNGKSRDGKRISIKGRSDNHRRSPGFPSKGSRITIEGIPCTASSEPFDSIATPPRKHRRIPSIGTDVPRLRTTKNERAFDCSQTMGRQGTNERLSRHKRAFVEAQSCVCQKACVGTGCFRQILCSQIKPKSHVASPSSARCLQIVVTIRLNRRDKLGKSS